MELSNSLGSGWNIAGLVFQGVKGVVSYCAGTSQTSKYNALFIDRLEALSLIVSLAIASLLPANYKPSLSNHRIVWHPPMPIGKLISIDCQWIYRSGTNFLGYEISDHKLIIPKYYDTIEKALKMHFSQDSDKTDKLSVLFNAAVGGLKKHLITYARKEDGTIDKINRCITLIESNLSRSKVMVLLKSPTVKITGSPMGASPTSSPINTPPNFQNSKDPLNEKKTTENKSLDSSQRKTKDLDETQTEMMSSSAKGDQAINEVDKDIVAIINTSENSNKNSSIEITSPLKGNLDITKPKDTDITIFSSSKENLDIIQAKEKVINKPEDSKNKELEIELDKKAPLNSNLAEKINLSEHNSEILAYMNPFSNVKLTTLDEANKLIWDRMNFIGTIVDLFNEVSKIPESDRENSLTFKNGLVAIDSFVNMLCSEFENLLDENSKNGLAPKI